MEVARCVLEMGDVGWGGYKISCTPLSRCRRDHPIDYMKRSFNSHYYGDSARTISPIVH